MIHPTLLLSDYLGAFKFIKEGDYVKDLMIINLKRDIQLTQPPN